MPQILTSKCMYANRFSSCAQKPPNVLMFTFDSMSLKFTSMLCIHIIKVFKIEKHGNLHGINFLCDLITKLVFFWLGEGWENVFVMELFLSGKPEF